MYLWLHSCVRGRVLQHREVTRTNDLTWLPGLGVTPQVKKHLAYALIHSFLNSLVSLHALLLHLQLSNAAVIIVFPLRCEETGADNRRWLLWQKLKTGLFFWILKILEISLDWMRPVILLLLATITQNTCLWPAVALRDQSLASYLLTSTCFHLKTLTPYNPLLLILSQTLGHISLRPFLVRF